MLIGDILIAQGLVTPEDVEAALERQRTQGGILGEHLIAMGKLDPADLERGDARARRLRRRTSKRRASASTTF